MIEALVKAYTELQAVKAAARLSMLQEGDAPPMVTPQQKKALNEALLVKQREFRGVAVAYANAFMHETSHLKAFQVAAVSAAFGYSSVLA